MPTVKLSALTDVLKRADYPAMKDDLVVLAEQSNAGDDVKRALRSLPLAEYTNRDEVIRSVTVDIGG